MEEYTHGTILTVDIEKEMRKSFIDYAMSVIVARALPDVRDGFKPVHRRILYTMYEENLTPDKPFRKSATAVGDVLGRYHPHGDASVYDALVRMAQDFSLRYILVDGHGNFGSMDGDPPAAYRYTEARLSKLALEMTHDIEKETVDFAPNYDNRLKEPTVLPSRFPNLLVNGSSGIAVGMATNIPPHNMREVCDAALYILDNENAELIDLLEIIKGPDFPTGGVIMGMAGIRAAYSTGRGRVKIRARCEIETYQGRRRIRVSEMPYQNTNKNRLQEHIAELVKDKRIEGISDVRDESDHAGVKFIIDLKRDANENVVLNQLYQLTDMQTTFAVNMLALVDGQPRTLGLRAILDCYIAHRRDIVTRRTQFELRKARERIHLLEGLKLAVDNIDEVIRIIRAAYNDAKQKLQERFGFSDVQAQAIVDMRLGRLQGLEVEKLTGEINELGLKIADYTDILAKPERVNGIIKTELTEVRDKYGDERRTSLEPLDDEIDVEDLIPEEDCAFSCSHLGYIKRTAANVYKAQNRGGRGVAAQATRDEDFIEDLFIASSHDTLLFFTNWGRLYRKRGFSVPESGRNTKGLPITNLLALESGEHVAAIIPVRREESAEYLVMVTKRGTVKRIRIDELDTALKTRGIRALKIREDDELIAVRKTKGDQNFILATKNGYTICFDENDVRDMGRQAAGVRGIKLGEGDEVIGAARTKAGASLLMVTENGYGKRVKLEDLMRSSGDEKVAQSRGGKGLRSIALNDKTGMLASVKVVSDEDDVLVISDDGVIIRTAADSISAYGRGASGVIIMRLGGGARVVGTARAEREIEEEIESETSGG